MKLSELEKFVEVILNLKQPEPKEIDCKCDKDDCRCDRDCGDCGCHDCSAQGCRNDIVD